MADTLIESLRKNINPILGVRDLLGAEKHKQYILTRTWSGSAPGDGTAVDTKVLVDPSPNIVDLSHDKRVQESGNFKRGDLFLKMISKQTFPLESEIDGSSTAKNIEKFYFINDRIYTVISVTEDHIWWNVQIRKHTKQRTYFA